MDFRLFIINEARSHLGEKVGDILTSLQNLNDDSANLSNKKIMAAGNGIADNIRPILRDNWPDTERSTLQTLQKVAVALKKAIDSNEDLKETISASVQELEQATNKLGEPLNQIGSKDDS